MPYIPEVKPGHIPKSPTDATIDYYVPSMPRILPEDYPPKPLNLRTIDHPSHYNTGKVEVIDFIVDQNLGFHEGNVIKYICRAKHKNNELEDLKKAKWYLDHLIQVKENQD